MLLECAVNLSKERGVKTVELTSNPSREVANALYDGHEADLETIKRPLNKYRNSYSETRLSSFYQTLKV